jgi:uncharacterized membrane protein YjdF
MTTNNPLRKVIQWIAFLVAAILFIYSSIQVVEGKPSWFMGISFAISVIGTIWILGTILQRIVPRYKVIKLNWHEVELINMKDSTITIPGCVEHFKHGEVVRADELAIIKDRRGHKYAYRKSIVETHGLVAPI